MNVDDDVLVMVQEGSRKGTFCRIWKKGLDDSAECV
jgi:hypothetical protein